MNQKLPISRVISLIPEGSQRLWSIDESEARLRLLAGDTEAVLRIDGSFALIAQDGERVVLARSLDRPMRYFLAKSTDGPVLIVAERMDEIAAELGRRGWAELHAHGARASRDDSTPDRMSGPKSRASALFRPAARHAPQGSGSYRPSLHRGRI